MSDPVLRQMILDAPAQVDSIDLSIDMLDIQIADFQAKQDALKNSVCDKVALDLETYLIGTKFTPITNYYMYKGVNFNQSLLSSGSIIDWKTYKVLSFGASFVAVDTFSCTGDKTGIFTMGADLSLLLGGGRVYSTVLSSSFNGAITEVILNDAIVTNPITSIWVLEYSYSPGDDLIIDGHKTNWDFAHDYIILPMGMTGTYGTQDNIAKLNIGKSLLNANRTKINNSIVILTPFI